MHCDNEGACPTSHVTYLLCAQQPWAGTKAKVVLQARTYRAVVANKDVARMAVRLEQPGARAREQPAVSEYLHCTRLGATHEKVHLLHHALMLIMQNECAGVHEAAC